MPSCSFAVGMALVSKGTVFNDPVISFLKILTGGYYERLNFISNGNEKMPRFQVPGFTPPG